MKRALILVVVLSTLAFGCGWRLDSLQRDTAQRYMQQLLHIRQLVREGRVQDAVQEERYVHALWQHDCAWLNCLISHHHTRDVSSALFRLSEALDMRRETLAVLAVDDALDALEEVARSEQPVWENIL